MGDEAEVGDETVEDTAAALVDLGGHEPVVVLDDVRGHAQQAQRVGGLESEQATTDDDAGEAGGLGAFGGGADAVEIVERAVDEAAGQVVAGHGGHEGVRAGREDEAVVGQNVAAGGGDGAGRAVDSHGAGADTQVDEVVCCVVVSGEGEFLAVPGSDVGRQSHAVVGGVGLLAEHGHRPAVLLVADAKGFDEAVGDHSVSDDDDVLAAHDVLFLRAGIGQTATRAGAGASLDGSLVGVV